MKKVIITMLLLAGVLVNAQGIKFYKGDFSSAIAKAKKENKLVFIDFYTTWCGPCKAMDANIFPNEKVGELFNKEFVAIKIDAEKGEGITLAKKYKVKGYPTMLYLNTDETEKERLVGATPNADFLIEYTNQALGHGEKFTDFFKAYEEQGDRNLDYIRDILVKGPVYAQGVEDEEEQRKWFNKFFEISKWYFALKQPKDLLNAGDFKLIAQYLDGPNNHHPVVNFVYNHYEDYKKLVPVKDLTMFILRTNNQSIHDSYQKGNENFREYLGAIKGRLKQAHIDGEAHDTFEVMTYVAEAGYAKSQGDYDGYLDWSDKYKDFQKQNNSLDARSYMATVGNLLFSDKDKLNKTQIKRCHKLVAEGLKLDTKNTGLIINQGDLYSLQGKKEKARECYENVKKFAKGTRSEDYYAEAMNKKIKALDI